MSDGAERVAIHSLGTDDCGVGAEAVLYADGDVTIQNNDNEGLVLNREQVQAFVSFVVGRMVVEVPQ